MDAMVRERAAWHIRLVILGVVALWIASPCGAESKPNLTAEQVEQTRIFVDGRLAVWSQYLGFEDWTISVVMTPRRDLKSKTIGGIRWDKDKKTAVIRVLDPTDYPLTFAEMLEDMETTIVHELVHLGLSSLPRSEASRGNEERAVNRLTEALLRLERQK